MRILHLTDTHLTAKNPASRLDIYYQSLLAKLDEITMLIQQENVDLIIHTGDLFHSPRVAPKLVGDILTRFRAWNRPILIVPGNHDLDGYNLHTIDQTMLGLIAKTGLIHLLTRETPYEVAIEDYILRIEGQEYDANLDKGNPKDYQMQTVKDCNILAIHGMLMEAPYFPEVPHTLIEDVETNAQVVLCGHYHPGFEQTYLNGTMFLNPGSMARVEISKREPKLYLLDIEVKDQQLQLTQVQPYYFKTIASAQTIFDFHKHEEKKETKQQLLTLKESIQQAVSLTQGHPLDSILEEVAKSQALSDDIVSKALSVIDEAKQADPTLNQEIKGYQMAQEPIWLTEVEIEHFLSHDKTHFTLAPDLNVILGETNSGKTSLIRAIIWCLYNEPRGTDFIRTGEDFVRVACTFSHGYRIERFRTKNQSGYYEVTNPDGVVERYQGFGTELPVQVLDAHQMPPVYLTKDQSVKLTVNEQLDAPFLLSESPQTKAMMVGRLVGTHYMDAAIKLLNKKTSGTNRMIKTYQQQIEKWEKQLQQFDDLEEKKWQLDQLEFYDTQRETLEQEIKHYQQLLKQHQSIQIQKQQVQQVLNQSISIEEVFMLSEQVEDLLFEITEGQELVETYHQVQDKLLSLQTPTFTYDFNQIEETITQSEQLIQVIEKIIPLHQRFKTIQSDIQMLHQDKPIIDFDQYTTEEKQANHLLAEVQSLWSMWEKANEASSKRDNYEFYLAEREAAVGGKELIELEEAKAHLLAVYQEQGICPTCGTPYDTKQLTFLLENVEDVIECGKH